MNDFSPADYRYMAQALRLAEQGLFTTDPNPRVGCVLVADREVVSEGWHERAGEAHAEVNAIAAAAGKAVGGTAYVTLEPCVHQGRTGPCTEALIEAGVAEVVIAMSDPNPLVAGKGIARLEDAGIRVRSGLLETEAAALNPGFIKRMQADRPFVRVKLAQSLDGRTALASGESNWITGEAARADVQRWRARASAVLTGIGTVLADDPRLDQRLVGVERQPLRVILDSDLRCPPDARLFGCGGKVLILASETADSEAERILQAAGAEVVRVGSDQAGLNWTAIMSLLAEREVNELHVEAGASLAGSLLQAGLADELLIYTAPVLLGSEGLPLFKLPGLKNMQERQALVVQEQRAVGDDWRIRATLKPANVHK